MPYVKNKERIFQVMTISIQKSEVFERISPRFVGAAIISEVINGSASPELWNMVECQAEALQAAYNLASIKLQSGIAATRATYKVAGKDPSRYRPACEQLARRVLQGKGLSSVNTLVDIGNLISLHSGYSTAAIDADKLVSEKIVLDFGRQGEPYVGIGRGVLNIENLPAYRDAAGAFATPTSDSERTMVSLETRKLLFIINGYDGRREVVADAVERTCRLLGRFAAARINDIIWY